jgi:hypothetical protein
MKNVLFHGSMTTTTTMRTTGQQGRGNLTLPGTLPRPPSMQQQRGYSAAAAINQDNNQLLESTTNKQRGQTIGEMVLRESGDDDN